MADAARVGPDDRGLGSGPQAPGPRRSDCLRETTAKVDQRDDAVAVAGRPARLTTALEVIKFSRPRSLPGVEIMAATNTRRHYQMFHETYAVCTLLIPGAGAWSGPTGGVSIAQARAG